MVERGGEKGKRMEDDNIIKRYTIMIITSLHVEPTKTITMHGWSLGHQACLDKTLSC